MTQNNLSLLTDRVKCLEADLTNLTDRVKQLETKKSVERPRQFEEKKREAQNAFQELDFTLNIRAFTYEYAVGKNGTQKFVLILARRAKGEVGKRILLVDIEKEWNTMKALLGEFNRNYTDNAKKRGWVNPEGRGYYCLSTNWEKAFK